MTTYVVLLPGDEDVWEQSSPEGQAAVFERHAEFSRLLAERGHTVTGGAELTHSRTTRKVSKDADGRVLVTDGPYAETVEQLSGFDLVDSDDLDDLTEICAFLAGTGQTIEVRAAVDHSGSGDGVSGGSAGSQGGAGASDGVAG